MSSWTWSTHHVVHQFQRNAAVVTVLCERITAQRHRQVAQKDEDRAVHEHGGVTVKVCEGVCVRQSWSQDF